MKIFPDYGLIINLTKNLLFLYNNDYYKVQEISNESNKNLIYKLPKEDMISIWLNTDFAEDQHDFILNYTDGVNRSANIISNIEGIIRTPNSENSHMVSEDLWDCHDYAILKKTIRSRNPRLKFLE